VRVGERRMDGGGVENQSWGDMQGMQGAGSRATGQKGGDTMGP
jgi:hypothetical protein